MGRLLGHATGHARHEPRGAVLAIVGRNFLRGVERIIPLGKGVLEVVASAQGVDTQDVVEMETFVTRNGGCKITTMGKRSKR